MSSALSTAVNGIDHSVARATHAASDIVKASSTGKNIDKNLIKVKEESSITAANATVVKAAQKEQKALLDIKV